MCRHIIDDDSWNAAALAAYGEYQSGRIRYPGQDDVRLQRSLRGGSTATIDPHAPCVYVATARDFGRHNTTITPTAVSLPGRLDPCNDKVRKYRPTERECIRRPFRAGSFIAHVNCRLMDFSGYQMRRVNKWQKWPVDFCFYLMIAERGVALKRATEGDDAQKKEKKGAKVDNDRFYCDFW